MYKNLKSKEEIKMIALGCDQGGFALKQEIMAHLKERGLEFKDYGSYDEQSVDYPVYAKKVAEAILSGECEKGILICGTGIGISISANKVKGVRCALCSDTLSAKMTRLHNDANVLVMPGRYIDTETASQIMEEFFNTEFEGGRHQKRIDKIPVK